MSVFFLYAMMTNMCHMFFMFISEKYMSSVFMYKWKICLWVSDRRQWSAVAVDISQSWCVLIMLCSLVSFNVVVVVEIWCWRGYELVSICFFLFFSFLFIAVVFILFCGDEDGWWRCFDSRIWSENHKYVFLDWRYGFFSSVIVLLAMQISIQHDWLYHDVARNG